MHMTSEMPVNKLLQAMESLLPTTMLRTAMAGRDYMAAGEGDEYALALSVRMLPFLNVEFD